MLKFIKMSESAATIPNPYLPPRGDGSIIVGFSRVDTLLTDENGLYYREQNEVSDLDPTHLQTWVERAWKTPHFSAESDERLGEKLLEETVEFIEAYEKYRTERTIENRAHFLEEAGDILWVWIAESSNVGLVVETVLAQQVEPQDDNPVDTVENTETMLQKVWRGNYAVPAERVSQIYRQTGFEYDGGVSGLPATPTTRLLYNAVAMRAGTQAVWSRHDASPRPHEVIAYASASLGPLIADSLLQLGTLVQSEGGDMGEVLLSLKAKNEQRVAENAIDRSDPGRLS